MSIALYSRGVRDFHVHAVFEAAINVNPKAHGSLNIACPRQRQGQVATKQHGQWGEFRAASMAQLARQNIGHERYRLRVGEIHVMP